ncbi:hypothetical protein, partial [Alkaliphilus pronyensis]|uniref:hypothetical protein n=1 Tax=Alkaliphilus pronyensis TaxID=1482732 RepID=UPI00186579EB
KEIISTNTKEYSIELTTEKPIASTAVDFTLETHQYAKITYSHLVIDGGTTGEAKEIFYHIGDVPTGLNSYNLLTADEASNWLNLDRYGWDIGITHY